MIRKSVLMVMAVLLLGSLAQAAVKKGDTEIELSGHYSRYNATPAPGVAIDLFEAQTGFGYFVTDVVQVGAYLRYMNYESGSTDLETAGLGVRGRYHCCPKQPLVPYVVGELEYAKGFSGNKPPADRKDGGMAGIGVGARYELNPQNDFLIEYIWHFELFDDFTKSVINLDEAHMLRFGIVHKFCNDQD